MTNNETENLQDTLTEREKRYGSFKTFSELCQEIKSVLNKNKNFQDMESHKKEAIEMIVHKLCRAINGDSDYVDTWVDIVGYATLVIKEKETVVSKKNKKCNYKFISYCPV